MNDAVQSINDEVEDWIIEWENHLNDTVLAI